MARLPAMSSAGHRNRFEGKEHAMFADTAAHSDIAGGQSLVRS
jgi:hypothetical protein